MMWTKVRAIAIGAVVLMALCGGSALGQPRPGLVTIRAASGALTAGETGTGVVSEYGNSLIIFLDVTTITTPDADDEVDFYVQTSYDGGTSWTDIENVHFTTADNGTTTQRVIVIDGAKDGPGANLSVSGTDPAANTEVSEAVPANTIWRLGSVALALVTDATAATRTVAVTIDDGSTDLLPYTAGTTQIESLTRNYILEPVGFVRTAVGTEIYIPIPEDLVLTSGSRIVTTTTNIQATDNYGAPQLHVDAWHDSTVSTDATMGDNLKSYDRPLGSQIRIKTAVTGSTSPTYAFSARGVFR